MSSKAVVLREAASEDIEAAVAYYFDTASADVALRLVDSLERALAEVAEQPGLGPPRFAHELDVPGLRTWLVPDFPFAVFYVESATEVHVWRVLHTKRDLGAFFAFEASE